MFPLKLEFKEIVKKKYFNTNFCIIDLLILVVFLIKNCIIKKFKLASHKQNVLKSPK